jgi:low affinity Fe/Cu permease
VVLVYALLWLIFDRATFDWSAVATLAVFVMTLFIQRANRRDNLALHAKLDERLRVNNAARSELTQLDEQEPEMIVRHRGEETHKSRRA